MNHAYRLVWNEAHRRYVPAPETAKGRGKNKGRALRRSAAVLALGSSLVGLGALAGPTGGTVSAGSGSISQISQPGGGSTTTITQASQNLAINWASFSTAAGERVVFAQPNASAIALNRVIGTQASVLNGSLSANGQVWILNPNGVLFGSTASVDVGGLVASTLSLNDADFLAGARSFSGDGSQGSVLNQGSLTGGYVALLGRQVSNTGSVTAGAAALAAGDKITLAFSGSQLLNVQVDEGTFDALVENKGLVRADNGTVILTASAKDALLGTVVNNQGVIEARGIDASGGTILLLGGSNGGTVLVGGTLDASASGKHSGGFIETSGAQVQVADGARVSTLSAAGKTGTWLIDPTDFTIGSGSASQTSSGIGATTLSNNLASNNITLETDNSTGTDSGDIHVNAAVTWSGNTTLTLNANRNVNINAAITATGDNAGLALNFGGAYNIAAPVTLSGANATLALNGTAYTLISSMAQLDALDGASGQYALAVDLDASGTTYTNAVVSGTFSGSFAGLGHTISHLTISAPDTDEVGLFAQNRGTIRDLGLVGGSVLGHHRVGGLVGYHYFNSTISNAYTTGSVSGREAIGGLVGYNDGAISNAYTTGKVSGTGFYGVGGLVGDNGGPINNAYATGSVSGNNDVGGLVGFHDVQGHMENVYATGSVSGTQSVGGLVGLNVGSIRHAHATGSVSGIANQGGLVGWNDVGSISDAHWDTATTGMASAIGRDNGTANNLNAVNSSTAYNHSSYTQLGTWTETASGSGVWVAADGSGNKQWVMVEGATRPFLFSEYSTSVRNAHQLQLMAYDLGASYTLSTHIDASETSGSNASGLWTTSGFSPVGNDTVVFSGSLDGQGHTISDLRINRSSSDFVGLFGISTGRIADLGLVGGSVSGINFVGALVGVNGGGSISNAYATGGISVTGYASVGGLAGGNDNGGTISHAYATGNVSGTDLVGGLLGFNGGSVSAAHATGSVSGITNVGGLAGYNQGSIGDAYTTGGVSGNASVGGLVGFNHGIGSISNVYATGNVSGGGASIGGLAGSNSGAVSHAYATGRVAGDNKVGGLVGFNDGSISAVYATGGVVGVVEVGGLVGFNQGSVSNAYASGSTSSEGVSGGLVGYNQNTGSISNAYWDSSSTGQPVAVSAPFGSISNVDAVTSSTAYNHSGYTALGTWTETASGSGVWVARDGSGNPQWVMMEGATRPFLYSEYSTSIRNAHQLQLMAYDLGASYTLSNHIDASEASGSNASGLWTTSGFSPLGNSMLAFSGHLDGQNHTIANLSISRTGTDYVGLFGYLGSGGQVSNLGLVGGSVSGHNQVGGLAGWNAGTISSVYATGSVAGSGDSTGGLVGANAGGSISDAHATGNVAGSFIVGGLVGWNHFSGNLTGSISNAYATGHVTGSSSVGGLVGASWGGSISNAYASGNVSANDSVGGLVGDNRGRISAAYATGSVSGVNNVGGLVGTNHDSIVNAYATGGVAGTGFVGGLVGYNESSGSISNAYWDSSSTGMGSAVGGAHTDGSISNVNAVTSSTAYNHSGYTALGTWTETASGSGVWVARDGSGNPQWVMMEGATRPFLYSEYSTSVSNAHQLQLMAYDLGASYTLSNNIDASEANGSNASGLWTTSGFSPVGNSTVVFNGNLDGQNHSISNLTIHRAGSDNAGLFGTNIGSVANLGLVGGSVSGRQFVGTLAGVNAGSINNVYATGTVTGASAYTGGLVGYNSAPGSINNAYATGNVTGASFYTGGLVGANSGNGRINNAHATGNVSGASDAVGGLVGGNLGTITNAYATGTVAGAGNSVGGLTGANSGSVSAAYATGSVTGASQNTGGLVGSNSGIGSIHNAYATGSVTGASHYTGGLVGLNLGTSSISNAYATGNVSGAGDAVGGLVGGNLSTVSNAYATGLVSGGGNHIGGLVGVNNGAISNALWDSTTTGQSSAVGTNNGAASNLNDVTSSTAYDHSSYNHLGNWVETASGSGVWVARDGSNNPQWVMVEGATRPFLYSEYSTNVRNAHQLQLMAYDLGASYTLSTHIDASETSGSNASGLWNTSGFSPVGNSAVAFSGSLDGQGHTVSHLTINAQGAGYVGLFGISTGSIADLGLVGGSVSGGYVVGALAGLNNGSISNAYATSSVSGTSSLVGGLVGENQGSLSNVYATGNVSGNGLVGGLAGSNGSSGSVSHAYATGHVSGSDSVGGLVGDNSGSVSATYATGSVSGVTNVGGLVGYNYNGGSISSAYATGGVSGTTSVGGLVGYNGAGSSISSVYWDSSSTGVGSAVGFAYPGSSSSNVNAVTSGTAYNQSSYARLGTWTETASGSGVWVAKDGNGNPQWVMVEGATRPFLYSEYSTSVRNAHQLQLMAYDLGASYTLSHNIDASETSGSNASGLWTTSGFSPVGNSTVVFSGSLDGQGHTISNLTINRSGTNFVGLFGTSAGSIANLGLVGGRVSGADYVGALVGYNNTGGRVGDASATGSVSGSQFVGGLVGFNDGSINASHATGSVSGDANLGGLVGVNNGSGTISNAHASGAVAGAASSYFIGGLVGWNIGSLNNAFAEGSVSGDSYLGGLVGVNDGSTSNAYASGAVVGTASSYIIGGLVGYSSGSLHNAFATGRVSGDRYLGGLVGVNEGNTSNAYAEGSVAGTGDHVGGLVGFNSSVASIGNSHAIGGVSGSGSKVGALVGHNEADATITASFWLNSVSTTGIGAQDGTVDGLTRGLSAREATSASTYTAAGWDVATAGGSNAVWRSYDGNGMPLLRSFLTALTVTTANTGKTYDGSTNQTSSYTLGDSSADASLILGTASYNTSSKHVGSYTLSTSGLYSTQHGYDISYANGSATITAATLNVSGATAASKTYDGTTVATVTGGSLSGLVNGDSVTLSQSGSFSDKNVGSGKAVTESFSISGSDAGNYVLASSTATTTANIGAATLSVSGATAANKTYDGTTSATVTGGTLNGVLGSDSVTLGQSGSFSDKNVGSGKTVTESFSISGSDAGNYVLASSSGTTTANIGAATLSVNGATAANKTYDGTTIASITGGSLSGVVNGDSVTLSQTGSFSDKNVGSGKTVTETFAITGTDAGNYVLASSTATTTASITAATLSVTANNDSRVANGSAYSGGNGLSYSGFVASEGSGVLSGSLVYGGSSQGATVPGRYTIVASGLGAVNYRVVYVDGTLLISSDNGMNDALSSVFRTAPKQAPADTATTPVSVADCGMRLQADQVCSSL